MAIRDRLIDAARSLLGVSVYEGHSPVTGLQLDSEAVESVRKALGGSLQPITIGGYRWYLADLETAFKLAESGDLSRVGQLWRSMKRDGLISGLAATRTAGLVALPRRFRGDADIISELTAENESRSIFDEMFPPAELAQIAADGEVVGVGVGELVPVVNRSHPILVRHDPQYLRYRYSEGRWYFMSLMGPIEIVPGGGQWILHTPGGRVNPWESGSWQSLGRAFIHKEHAMLHRGNFSGKLANPARVAYAPNAATEAQRLGFLTKLIAWGINTVFELPPGWDAKLLESNGRGWEVFGKEIEDANLEIMINIAGQVVTVTGGTGFANANIHKMIRADLIKQTGDALAYTLNTQGIPAWIVQQHGIEKLKNSARIEWDTRPPVDRKEEAEAMSRAADAIERLGNVLDANGFRLALNEIVSRFGIPIEVGETEKKRGPGRADLDSIKKAIDLAESGGKRPTQEAIQKVVESYGLQVEDIPQEGKKVRLELAPTDVAKVVRVDEARGSQGLEPLGGEQGGKMISELEGGMGGGEVPKKDKEIPVEKEEEKKEENERA